MAFYNSLSKTNKAALVGALTGAQLGKLAQRKTLTQRASPFETVGKAARYVGDVARGGLTSGEKQKVVKAAKGALIGSVGAGVGARVASGVKKVSTNFRKGYYGK